MNVSENCSENITERVKLFSTVCVIFIWVPALGPAHFLLQIFSSSQDGYKVGHRNHRTKPEAEAGTRSQGWNRQEWEYEVDTRMNTQQSQLEQMASTIVNSSRVYSCLVSRGRCCGSFHGKGHYAGSWYPAMAWGSLCGNLC